MSTARYSLLKAEPVTPTVFTDPLNVKIRVVYRTLMFVSDSTYIYAFHYSIL